MNFSPKLKNSSYDKLEHLINETSPDIASLASDELTRRSLNNLRENIKIFNEQSSKQTEKLVVLTWWIVILTIFMCLGLIIQIILAILGR
jgi:hypothetical protein